MLVAQGGDRGDPVDPGEVDRPLGGDPDGALLGLGFGRVGRVVEAVAQPRVDEEAQVDDVDADQAGDVGAVAVVVLVDRVDAGRMLARPRRSAGCR